MKIIFLTVMSLLSSLAFANPQGRSENILGYLPSQKGLTFQVSSGGCTTKSDFTSTSVKAPESGLIALTLIRLRPDNCFPFLPMGERLEFSFQELGITSGDDFIITNENGVVQAWAYEFPTKAP